MRKFYVEIFLHKIDKNEVHAFIVRIMYEHGVVVNDSKNIKPF